MTDKVRGGSNRFPQHCPPDLAAETYAVRLTGFLPTSALGADDATEAAGINRQVCRAYNSQRCGMYRALVLWLCPARASVGKASLASGPSFCAELVPELASRHPAFQKRPLLLSRACYLPFTLHRPRRIRCFKRRTPD